MLKQSVVQPVYYEDENDENDADEHLILIDSSNTNDDDDNDNQNNTNEDADTYDGYSQNDEDEKTSSNNFKLKLSSSSSLSSHISTNTSTSSSESSVASIKSRMSTRQSIKKAAEKQQESTVTSSRTNMSESITTLDATNDVIIESEKKSSKKCMWNKCGYETNADESELIDHIQSKHVYSQKSNKKFKCLWKGCRVYKAQSSNFNWLERHVITHADSKPFACIINGCKRKFPTQTSLEKHVNTHMNQYETMSPSKQLKLQQQLNNGNPNRKYTQQLSNTSTITLSSASNSATATNNATNSLDTAKNAINVTGSSKASNLRKKSKVFESNKLLKKAKYKDYIDDLTYKLIEQRLVSLNYDQSEGTIKFRANVS